MKHHQFSQDQNRKPAGAARSATAEESNQDERDFAPSPDEVARRAYFTYVNRGAPQGQHVQHWLDAEAELTAERNRTRVHGFHHGHGFIPRQPAKQEFNDDNLHP